MCHIMLIACRKADVNLTTLQALSQKKDAELKRPADIRIMSSQYTSLQCWFFETWTEYNECQSDYREKCKEKLTRQIQISMFLLI